MRNKILFIILLLFMGLGSLLVSCYGWHLMLAGDLTPALCLERINDTIGTNYKSITAQNIFWIFILIDFAIFTILGLFFIFGAGMMVKENKEEF